MAADPRTLLARVLEMSRPLTFGLIWRLMAALLLLMNIKNLPGVWHLRFLYGYYSHFYIRPAHFTPLTGPRALFRPSILTARTPLYETDYNIHKSNSTYFSDLDIARTHLIASLMRHAIQTTAQDERYANAGERGASFGIFLGGVACSFKREIKPYKRYEIWSRILTWDRKWLFIISHFVEEGAVKPKGYMLQPGSGRQWWRALLPAGKTPAAAIKKASPEKQSGTAANGAAVTGNPSTTSAPPHRAVFATAISKYVYKKGRLTIPPEWCLRRSNLLPVKPDDAPEVTPAIGEFEDEGGEMEVEEEAEGEGEGEWSWARVERERRRGLKVAAMMAGLDEAHGFFPGGEVEGKDEGVVALGRYSDVVW